MDNREFDNRMRDLAIGALGDAYNYAKEHRSLEALVKVSELAGKMIDFREPARKVGFSGGEDDTES